MEEIKLVDINIVKLWKDAESIAAERFEEENGRSWDEADKYEREDYHFWAYTELEKQGLECIKN